MARSQAVCHRNAPRTAELSFAMPADYLVLGRSRADRHVNRGKLDAPRCTDSDIGLK